MKRNGKNIESLIDEIERIGQSIDCSVIIYNDEFHQFDEVVALVKTATDMSFEEAYEITLEAHINGHAVCYAGDVEECEIVADTLREGGLLVEVE